MSRSKMAGVAGTVLAVAAVVYGFVAPIARAPGVRLGGTETAAPSDWRTVNDEIEMELKVGGFPPFVVTIWFVGTEQGLITSSAGDGYWGGRTRADPNGRVRIGDEVYEVGAEEVVDPKERGQMVDAFLDKYPYYPLEATGDWAMFFWTAR